MTNDHRFLATNKYGSNQVDSFIFQNSSIGISVPMQDAFLFEAMKETNEQHKTKIDIDELITGPTNITLIGTPNFTIVKTMSLRKLSFF
jgi:hypothetical protein